MAVPHLLIPETVEAEELSDEQIDILLQQAEERLRNEAPASTTTLPRHLPKPPKLELHSSTKPYIETKRSIATADPEKIVDEASKRLARGVRIVEDPIGLKKRKLEAKKATAGPKWFNLPATNLTPELERDLRLLRMRSILDPKVFYKKDNTAAAKAAPPFSQQTTVQAGPTDFFSARVPRRDRQRTLVDEVLAGERANGGRFRKRYLEVQARKTSGRRGEYKRRMAGKYGHGVGRLRR